MPLTEFTIGVSRTINLGNFESLRIEASVRWDLEDTDNPTSVARQKQLAQAELRNLLELTYKNYEAKKKLNHVQS